MRTGQAHPGPPVDEDLVRGEDVDCDAVTAVWEEALRAPDPAGPPVWLGAGVDDATWIRGRGRTLSQALVALPYHRTRNPAMADNARHVIRAVLGEG